MGWREIKIQTTAQHASEIETQLLAFDAVAITYQDAGDNPIYEPAFDLTPSWQDTMLVALFDEQTNMVPALSFLQNNPMIYATQTRFVPDEDWERRCLADFKPMQFGERLWICPSWHQPPAKDAINIILDPGLAFGTGTHPTTSLCLTWLSHQSLVDMSVIDYGCGSGILAIAALKLGAKKLYAIDHDERALIATRENAQVNDIAQEKIMTALPDAFDGTPGDLLMANILAQPLISLAHRFAKCLRPKGKILLSGILIDQVDQVMAAYAPWFTFDTPVNIDQWVRLTGQLK